MSAMHTRMADKGMRPLPPRSRVFAQRGLMTNASERSALNSVRRF
jgi:hypothetical protein